MWAKGRWVPERQGDAGQGAQGEGDREVEGEGRVRKMREPQESKARSRRGKRDKGSREWGTKAQAAGIRERGEGA